VLLFAGYIGDGGKILFIGDCVNLKSILYKTTTFVKTAAGCVAFPKKAKQDAK
jgi:hypothetical protein